MSSADDPDHCWARRCWSAGRGLPGHTRGSSRRPWPCWALSAGLTANEVEVIVSIRHARSPRRGAELRQQVEGSGTPLRRSRHRSSKVWCYFASARTNVDAGRRLHPLS